MSVAGHVYMTTGGNFWCIGIFLYFPKNQGLGCNHLFWSYKHAQKLSYLFSFLKKVSGGEGILLTPCRLQMVVGKGLYYLSILTHIKSLDRYYACLS